MLVNILLYAPPLLIAVILHEIAHGYIALKLGDPTAKQLGRLSLNPLKHIDPFLTLILPGLLIFSGSPIVFGGAKPVPVNPNYFKNPRKAMALVALAGPVTNAILAFISYLLFSFILGIIGHSGEVSIVTTLVLYWLDLSIPINLVLGFFNLFPVPPLDGGRILVGILPKAASEKVASLERYGLLIVILCLATGIFDSFLRPVIHLSKYLHQHAAISSQIITAPTE